MDTWIDLELASAVCEGGRAISIQPSPKNASSVPEDEIMLHKNNKNDEDDVNVVRCEAPRLTRNAYVTIAVTIVALLAMINEVRKLN